VSSPLRIAVVESLPDWIRDLYAAELVGSDIELHWANADPAALAGVGDPSVLITGKQRVTAELIEAAASELRLIQVIGRAPWSVDFEAAERTGVDVSLMPHRGAIAVAEHALALALGVYRMLVPGHEQTTVGRYRERGIEPVDTDERTIAFNWMGFGDIRQLYGKTLGLVGLGDIGLEVARRARAFDMDVLYAKRTPVPAGFDDVIGARHVSLGELLERSDIVSLHAPHTALTAGMIGAAELDAMRETAVLINTSRGGLVDEEALAARLHERRIAGAGLDVFRQEPVPAENPLLELDNVLLSPHTGGGTGGGQKGLVGDVVANVRRFAEGDKPQHLFVQERREAWP
jgi:phosphoglycerate dehydrogenase-like enzyme